MRGVLCCGMALLLLGGAARAGTSSRSAPAVAAPERHHFKEFCASWLGRLKQREVQNLAGASARRTWRGVVLAYTGYGDRALQCQVSRTDVPGARFIGRLGYLEHSYERRGRDRRAALASAPVTISTTEVLEIFRHDGARWVY